MSSVFKLSIKGVRSFDPIETETIEFNKPLTLIVGSNGSGKTTIIECLKFATTGDFPPNSKGGAFIHDPNIGGEKSVIAQIKLAFNNINNKNMILTKTLQLVNKKTSNTFKTLENQLMVLNNGERVTISTKAADVEQLVPQFLGVTRSILNYVIFCHQEDSLWPISEPAVLKKRFDEIFDSVKYIKVLDNFKDLRKQFNEDIKLLTNNVEHLKQEKARASKKRMEKQGLETSITSYNDEIEIIEGELAATTAKLDHLFKSNQDYELIINKIESLQQQNHSLKSQITKLNSSIDLLKDSDDELQGKLSNFNEVQLEQRDSVNSLKSQLQSKSDTLIQRRKDFNINVGKLGEMKSLKDRYDENLVLRDALINTEYPDLELSPQSSLEVYMKQLEQLKDKHEKESEKLTEQLSTIKSDYDTRALRFREDRLKLDQMLRYFSDDIDNYKQLNEKISKRVSEITVDENDLILEKEELVSLKNDLASLKAENKIVALSDDISQTNREILSLESQVEELNHQISASSKQSESVTRLLLLKEQIGKLDKKIELLSSNNALEFQKYTQQELNPESCLEHINDAMELKRDDLETEELDLENSQQERYDLITQLKNLESESSKFEEELKQKTEIIQTTLPEDVNLNDYEEYVSDLQKDYDTMSENINITEVTVKFNEAALNSAKKDHYCVLCRRGFQDHELTGFLKMLEEHNAKIKKGIDTKMRDQLKAELDETRDLMLHVQRVRELESSGINEVNRQKEILQKEIDLKNAQLQNQKNALDLLKSDIGKLESMRTMARELERLQTEQHNLKTELDTLQDEFYGVDIKSVSKLQEEQDEVSTSLKKLRKNLTEFMNSKESTITMINRLELKVRERSLTITNKEKDRLDLDHLKRQFSDNEKQIELLEKSIEEKRDLYEQDEKEFKEFEEEYLELKLAVEINEREQQLIAHQYVQLFEKMNSLYQQINQYIENDLQRLLEYTKMNLVLEEEIDQLALEIDSMKDSIQNSELELLNSEKILRNIRDNIDIRNLEKELNENLLEINSMEEQNARVSRENYLQETSDLNQVFSKLTSEHLMKKGEILQILKQIESIESELTKDYLDIESRYNEEFLQLQTKFFVNNDLTVYSKALDNAIMKFHSLKMKEINEIIDQLWRTTYSGSDVDTIMIKSESNTTGVKSGNRSYNYRVVMVKQGVHLDMRGRCSAGQKVLASIIIRLALLECFGINFGMITLDEPTTNLDEDNIESLLKSLNLIIELRQKQKNFQLIVITHDEKFLRFMGALKFTDLYYRVSRDERQTSVIELVPISVINE